MSEREEMEIFLREMLMNIENEQSQIIRRLEDCHRNVESLNREKIIVEEKLKDNISFFNPSSAKNREKMEEINQKILDWHGEIDRVKNELQKTNERIVIMGKILNFIHDNQEETKEERISIQEGVSILEAQEQERRRIAREIHDSTVQSLTNVVHKTEYCSKMLEKDLVQVKLELITMMNSVRNSIDDMRNIIYDLRPMSIDDLGLLPTIQRFIDKSKEHHDEIDFQINVKSESDEVNLPSLITLTIFRIIQESCNNIFKHADAKKVNIDIFYEEDSIFVRVRDDGIGFIIEDVKKKKNTGFGLSIMKERAQLLGGTFMVESELAIGTDISIRIPYTVIDEIKNKKE